MSKQLMRENVTSDPNVDKIFTLLKYSYYGNFYMDDMWNLYKVYKTKSCYSLYVHSELREYVGFRIPLRDLEELKEILKRIRYVNFEEGEILVWNEIEYKYKLDLDWKIKLDR